MEIENYFKEIQWRAQSLPSRLSNTKQIFSPALKKKLSHTSDAEKNKYLLFSVIIFHSKESTKRQSYLLNIL